MTARVLLYCLAGGLPFTLVALGSGHPLAWFLSGVVLAASLTPIARFGPRSALGQFGVIAPALFFTSVFCTWTEAVVFFERFRADAVTNLVGATIVYLIFAVVMVAVGRLLRLSETAGEKPQQRSRLATAGLVLASGLAYVVYYLIFGSLTYQYFTRGFYPDAPAQVARLGGWFWLMEFGRGTLMAAAVLPMVQTLRMSRWPAAFAVGVFLWVAGGLAPLIVPSDFMGPAQRFIHTVEILTQNLPLGVTLVLLLRRPLAGRPLSAASAIRVV